MSVKEVERLEHKEKDYGAAEEQLSTVIPRCRTRRASTYVVPHAQLRVKNDAPYYRVRRSGVK